MKKNNDNTMNAKITHGKRDAAGWIKGKAKTARGEYEFLAKVYDEGSCYGIRHGRVSKLWISKNGKFAANYDRGWDTRPTDKGAKEALAGILEEFK